MYPDRDRVVFGPKTLSYIENDMARYICQKNVLPVLIPDVQEDLLLDILNELDGFVLQGGSDLAPRTYKEEPIGKWKGDPYRDQYELHILDYAIKHSKPVLGICRGLQLINVYFGGSLIQDIEKQLPEATLHRSAEQYDTIMHPLIFEENNFLQNMYQDFSPAYINSVHHQAIKTLGNNLEVFAHSEDGIIEAIGYTGEPEGKVFGVQWHPEFSDTLLEKVLPANRLIHYFLQRVSANNMAS